jgi:hypothetical protein
MAQLDVGICEMLTLLLLPSHNCASLLSLRLLLLAAVQPPLALHCHKEEQTTHTRTSTVKHALPALHQLPLHLQASAKSSATDCYCCRQDSSTITCSRMP